MIWWQGEDGQGDVAVNALTRETLLMDIAARLSAGQGFSIATLNLDHVVKLKHDPAFRTAYAAHSHVTADGNPIVWLSRLAGQDVHLVPGSELIEPVVELAARQNVPIGLFGSDNATLEAAAAALKGRHPGLEIPLVLAPPMGFDPTGSEADAAIEKMRNSGARVFFLALGAPKQEIFASRAQAMLPEAGFLSIGAGIDFIAGTQTRAPAWVRAVAGEWLWRLALSPKRLARRYASCIAILPRLTLSALEARRQ